MKSISNMIAAENAFRHTVKLLFKPFNFIAWLMLALSAWLSQIGTELSAWTNEIVKAVLKSYINEDKEAVNSAVREIGAGNISALKNIIDIDGLRAINPLWIVLGVGLFLALWVLLLWIRSQAQIIFIDNLVHKTTRVLSSFREHFQAGNSIFLWKIIYHLAAPLLVFGLSAFPLLLAVPWIKGCVAVHKISMPNGVAITGFVIAVTLLMFLSLAMKLLVFYFDEFIVPIVFIRRCNAFQATWIGAGLFKSHTWTFIKYALLYFLLYMAGGMLVMLVVLATCCTAFLLLMIPYVWAVLMLPLLVFYRLFGLELLNQMYKDEIW